MAWDRTGTPVSPGHGGLGPRPWHPWVVAGSFLAVLLARGELCPRPLVGRGRRSSISSSRLRPTSPCTSAGSRPRTTARCSSPTRWTSATSAHSSRARRYSSPRVSAVSPGGASWLRPSTGQAPRGATSGVPSGREPQQPPAWLCSGVRVMAFAGPPRTQPHCSTQVFADLDISNIAGGSGT